MCELRCVHVKVNWCNVCSYVQVFTCNCYKCKPKKSHVCALKNIPNEGLHDQTNQLALLYLCFFRLSILHMYKLVQCMWIGASVHVCVSYKREHDFHVCVLVSIYWVWVHLKMCMFFVLSIMYIIYIWMWKYSWCAYVCIESLWSFEAKLGSYSV